MRFFVVDTCVGSRQEWVTGGGFQRRESESSLWRELVLGCQKVGVTGCFSMTETVADWHTVVYGGSCLLAPNQSSGKTPSKPIALSGRYMAHSLAR